MDMTRVVKITGEMSETLGALSVTASRLRGGVRDGVLVVELIAGDNRAIVLPDRGLGIHKIVMSGQEFGWQSPVRGPVHPRFVPLSEPSGLGWLEGFDELVVRCGLISNGAPDFNANGSLAHSLHGRIANIPAEEVTVVLDLTTNTVTLSGFVDETRFLSHALRMRTSMTVHAHRPLVEWTDEVENLSDRPTTMQMLYHVNFGPPLLGSGARIVAPATEIAPRDDAAVADVPNWHSYQEPRPGRAEQVHYMKLRSDDSDGRASTFLVSPDGENAAKFSWRAAELPCFTLWKNLGGIADGFVTGFEPGTNYPNPRTFEESQGRVLKLAPRECVSFDLAIEHLAGKDAIGAACEALVGHPLVHPQPKPGWSNV